MYKDLKSQKEELCEECGELKESGCQCESDDKDKESDGAIIGMEEEPDEAGNEW